MLDIVTEEIDSGSIIRVVGVGGGGGNAAEYIQLHGNQEIECIAINTDISALNSLELRNKISIGRLGSGSKPEVAQLAATDHKEEIREALRGAEMVFLTAGMGKGTGTGATPVVAGIAREMGILTVGVVTIPFQFEGKVVIKRAIDGLKELRKNVDATLIIANEQIKAIYGDLRLSDAFGHADDTICSAIDGIAGAVLKTQGVCTDMADMRTTLEQSGNIMMGVGIASGNNRAIVAIRSALESPLLVNNDLKGAKNLILNYAFSPEYEITMDEISIVNDELYQRIGDFGDQIWGTIKDSSLGEKLKITIVATGIESVTDEELMEISSGKYSAQTAKKQPSPAPSAAHVAKPELEAMVTQPVAAPAAKETSKEAAPQQIVINFTEQEMPQKKKKLSLTDLEDEQTLFAIENSINEMPQSHRTTGRNYVGNDPSNPIESNIYLEDNVD